MVTEIDGITKVCLLLSTTPAIIVWLCNLADLHMKAMRFEKARPFFARAANIVKENPDYPVHDKIAIYANLEKCCIKTNQKELALAAREKIKALEKTETSF